MMSIVRTIRRSPLILPFYLPSLILAVSGGFLVPVLPLYAKGLDPSYTVVGLVLAGEGIGMLLGDIPAGFLVGRLGQKRTMLLGVACAALATGALYWAPTVAVAVVLRALAGFGQALNTVSRHAYIAGVVATGTRGRAIALFGGLMRIGRFLGPMAGGGVAAAYGLSSTFLLYAATHTAALAVMAIFIRVPPEPRDAKAPAKGGGAVMEMLRSRYRSLVSAGAGQLLAQTIRAGRSAIVPLYAADILGLEVQQIGLLISLVSAVDMSLFYPAGWIMDRLGRKYAIVPSFAIQALGMIAIPFANSFAGLLLAAGLIAVGNGLSSGSMMTLGTDLAPEKARGEFLGIWRLIGDVGRTGGPIVVGRVADLVALPVTAWAMAAAGLCAALVFGLLVPEPLKARDKR